MPQFEWDPDKEAQNARKHGIDFTTASRIWDGPVFAQIDNRREYGEIRFQAFGAIDNRVVTVVFTWRGTVRRIISARKASAREKRLFEAQIRDPDRRSPD